jgi:hypothetical protein
MLNSFFKIPAEVIIYNLIPLFPIYDLIQFSKVCRITRKYVYTILNCWICNKTKMDILEKQNIYNFNKCYKCNNMICKKCQSECYDCKEKFCDNCLMTEICDECEYYHYTSNSDDEF